MGPLAGKPVAGQAAAAGCSQEGSLQRQSLGLRAKAALTHFQPALQVCHPMAPNESYSLARPCLGSDANVPARPLVGGSTPSAPRTQGMLLATGRPRPQSAGSTSRACKFPH